jgi:hypothetical protein
MPSSGSNRSLNLSGFWRGQFSYPRRLAPVAFQATLEESDSWLVGATEEIATFGDRRGATITATIQGRRTGTSATWLKLYDDPPHFHALHYVGVVSSGGDEISGHWQVPGSWSGPFLMIRERGARIGRVREAKEAV